MDFPFESCRAQHNAQCGILSSFVNVTVLPTALKLAPDNDITGKTAVKVFLGVTVVVLLFSALLLGDRCCMMWCTKGNRRIERRFRHYPRIIHTIESVMEHLFQQQLFASFALIWIVRVQACTISAYYYNIVCVMLSLSSFTQLNVIINIADFISRHTAIGVCYMVLVILQLVLSWFMLRGMSSGSFPSEASSVAVAPAQCFMDIAALSGNSSLSAVQNFTTYMESNVTATNTTNNPNALVLNTVNSVSAATETWDSHVRVWLVVALVLACLFVFWDSGEAWYEKRQAKTASTFVYASYAHLLFSAVSISGSGGLVVWIFVHYRTLRDKQEIPAWFLVGKQEGLTLSQLLLLFMSIGSALTLIRALFDSVQAFNKRRWAEHITETFEEIKNAQGDYRRYQHEDTQLENYPES